MSTPVRALSPPNRSDMDTDSHANTVALDPARPFVPRPLVADILRTRYCMPGSVFLVEAVDPAVDVGAASRGAGRYRTVRLLLGDGQLCIQALLGAAVHDFVDSGQVYAGCYIRADRFEVRCADVLSGGGEGDTQPDQMVYLVVHDLAMVGWNSAYLDMLLKSPPKAGSGSGRSAADILCEPTEAGAPSRHQAPRPGSSTGPTAVVTLGEKASMKVDALGNNTIPPPPIRDHTETGRPKLPGDSGNPAALPWASDDPTKPLRLTRLGDIPNLPYKQNWKVNVLAVVASLSDVESTYLPPYIQRTARLADPSTGKQVLLTALLDAESFTPAVGSVVLVLGVKNHMRDGGSLRKYVSDRPKKSWRWWFEDPWELEWCDVAGLKDWWKGR